MSHNNEYPKNKDWKENIYADNEALWNWKLLFPAIMLTRKLWHPVRPFPNEWYIPTCNPARLPKMDQIVDQDVMHLSTPSHHLLSQSPGRHKEGWKVEFWWERCTWVPCLKKSLSVCACAMLAIPWLRVTMQAMLWDAPSVCTTLILVQVRRDIAWLYLQSLDSSLTKVLVESSTNTTNKNNMKSTCKYISPNDSMVRA